MRRKKFINRRKFNFFRRTLSFGKKHIWFLFGGGLIFIAFVLYLWHQFFLAHSQFVPAKGGVYTESTIGKIKNLNPLAAKTSLVDRDLHQLIFAGLLQYNPINQQIESGLAEFRVGADGKTYELTIKKMAKFSDGKPVTIEDVLFTYVSIIQHPHFANAGLKEAFEYVKLNVVNKNTVKFVLPEQNVFFPSLLTTPILPKHYFKDVLIEEIADPDSPFNKHPIGAGPFQLKNIVPEEDGTVRVFLEKNKYYYGQTPLLKQVVLYVHPDIKTLKQKHNWPTTFSHIPFADLPQIEKTLFDEYEPYEFLLPQFTGVFFNLDREITKNLYFRKAMNLGFQTENLISDEWQRINGPLFFSDIETSYQSPDFTTARKTLRDFGFPYDIRKETRTNGKKGLPIKLKFITSVQPAIYSQMAQKMKKTWERELDIEIELAVLNPTEFLETLGKRDYDLVLFGQNFSQNFDTLSLWHSSQSGRLNLSNFTRDDIDLAIAEVRFSGAKSDLTTLSERLDYLKPAIIFATPKNKILVAKKLEGFNEHFGKIRAHADRFYGIENWYFFQERTWKWHKGSSKILGFIEWVFSKKKSNLIPDDTKTEPQAAPTGSPTEEPPPSK